MASQVVGEYFRVARIVRLRQTSRRKGLLYTSGLLTLEGICHEYKSVWSPTVGETLSLTTELSYQSQDSFAVAVIQDGCVVGHVPTTVSRPVSVFLGKDGRVGFSEVFGLGLEIPCRLL